MERARHWRYQVVEKCNIGKNASADAAGSGVETVCESSDNH